MCVHCQNRERESQCKQIMPTRDNGGWPTLSPAAEKSLLTSVLMPGKQNVIYCLTSFKPSNPHTPWLPNPHVDARSRREGEKGEEGGGSGQIPEIRKRFWRINWSRISWYEAAPSTKSCLYYLVIKLLPRYCTGYKGCCQDNPSQVE